MKARRLVDVELLSQRLTDEQFLQRAKLAPTEMARSLTEDPFADRWIYRIVVVTLGLTALTALVGGLVVAYKRPEWPLPQMLVALGSTAVGALAGLLAPSPRDR
ncbi:hypothetical protein [Myxococcus eversor]|uniref:hypothetical protein n=1 Tax=Myxococcus eversor TaxID=2709661 RepID=UPI0013D63C2A|nr:hypothetical protein [Myxococcus eversor]